MPTLFQETQQGRAPKRPATRWPRPWPSSCRSPSRSSSAPWSASPPRPPPLCRRSPSRCCFGPGDKVHQNHRYHHHCHQAVRPWIQIITSIRISPRALVQEKHRPKHCLFHGVLERSRFVNWPGNCSHMPKIHFDKIIQEYTSPKYFKGNIVKDGWTKKVNCVFVTYLILPPQSQMKMQSSPKAGSAGDKFCQLAPLDNTISLLGWLQVTVLNISFGIYSHGWGCCLMKWLPKKSARRCVGIVWLVCRPLVSSPGGSSTHNSHHQPYYLTILERRQYAGETLTSSRMETLRRVHAYSQHFRAQCDYVAQVGQMYNGWRQWSN